eukprot:m51a1_g8183 hypothetical protein (1116) ;mRNA; f:141769-147935
MESETLFGLLPQELAVDRVLAIVDVRSLLSAAATCRQLRRLCRACLAAVHLARLSLWWADDAVAGVARHPAVGTSSTEIALLPEVRLAPCPALSDPACQALTEIVRRARGTLRSFSSPTYAELPAPVLCALSSCALLERVCLNAGRRSREEACDLARACGATLSEVALSWGDAGDEAAACARDFVRGLAEAASRAGGRLERLASLEVSGLRAADLISALHSSPERPALPGLTTLLGVRVDGAQRRAQVAAIAAMCPGLRVLGTDDDTWPGCAELELIGRLDRAEVTCASDAEAEALRRARGALALTDLAAHGDQRCALSCELLRALPRLTSLELFGVALAEATCRAVADLAELQHLTLKACSALEGADVARGLRPAKCRLISLSFRSSPGLLPPLLQSPMCSALRHLCVWSSSGALCRSGWLGAQGSGLETACLGDLDGDDVEALYAAAPACRALRRLELDVETVQWGLLSLPLGTREECSVALKVPSWLNAEAVVTLQNVLSQARELEFTVVDAGDYVPKTLGLLCLARRLCKLRLNSYGGTVPVLFLLGDKFARVRPKGLVAVEVMSINGSLSYEDARRESPGPSKEAAPEEQHLSLRNKLLLVEMLLLTLSVMATEMTVSPALPRISVQYPEYQSWVPWTLAAYNVVGSVWTPIAGSLGDIFGVKWITLVSLCIYLVGQIGCALSRNIFVLIAFRAVQGVGMGIFVLCFTAIKKTFPPRWVPLALGVVSGMFSVGTSFGFVGGAGFIKLLEHTRWEYVFLFYVPFLLVVIVAFYFTMPDVKRDPTRRVDFVGAALLGVGVTALLVGLTLSDTRGWRDGAVLGLVVGGAVVMAAFLAAEFFIKDPMVDVSLLFTRDILTIGCVVMLVGFALFSTFQTLPFLYQFKLGYTDPVAVGLLMLPFGLAQLPVAPVAAIVGRRHGFYVVITVALTFMTIGYGLYIKFNNTVTQATLINILCGASMGGVTVSILNVVSEHTTPQQFGSASGTNMLMRIIGAAVGPIVVNLILFRNSVTRWREAADTSGSSAVSGSDGPAAGQSYQVPVQEGYRDSFMAICAASAAALMGCQVLSHKFKSCQRAPRSIEKGEGGNAIDSVTVVTVCKVELDDTSVQQAAK